MPWKTQHVRCGRCVRRNVLRGTGHGCVRGHGRSSTYRNMKVGCRRSLHACARNVIWDVVRMPWGQTHARCSKCARWDVRRSTGHGCMRRRRRSSIDTHGEFGCKKLLDAIARNAHMLVLR